MTSPSEDRTKYLGGSDAASILGVSPWRGAFRCWCEKTGVESPPDLSSVFYIYWGNVLEGVVADEFSRRTGLKVRAEPRLLRHATRRFLAGHVDRRVPEEKTFLECKTSNAWDYSHWGAESAGRDGVPLHYLAQCDHYMMVLNSADHCYLAALIGGSDFRLYRIDRSEKAERELLAAELEFWRRVQEDDPPEVTTEADARLRWRQAQEGTAKEIDMAMMEKVRELNEVKMLISSSEKREAALLDVVIPAFEDRESLSYNGSRVARLTNFSQTRLDTGAFKASHPDLHAQFCKKIVSRRLKITL